MAFQKTFNATAALVFSRAWSSIAGLATLWVIGHSVTPNDFGLFVLGSSLAFLPMLTVGAGFYETVLTRKTTPYEFSTAYWCAIFSGLAGSLLIAGGATVLWALGWDTTVVAVMTGLAVLPTLWAIGQMHEAAMIRDGNGSRLAMISFCAELSGLCAMLVGALLGYGIAALVAARVINSFTSATAFTLVSPHSVLYGFDRRFAMSRLRFSAGIFANRFMSWCDGYGVDLLLAVVLPIRELGFYKMGTRLHSSAYSVVMLAPSVAQNASMGRAYALGEKRIAAITRRFMIIHSALALPVFAALAASSTLVISILLSPEWADAKNVLVVLCLSAPFAIFFNAANATLLVMHRARQLTTFTLASLLVGGIALAVGASMGPVGAASLKVLAVGLLSVAFFAKVSLLRGAPLRSALWAMAGVVSACAVQFAVTYCILAETPLHSSNLVQLFLLAVANAIGTITYLALLRVTSPHTFRLLLFIILRTLPGADRLYRGIVASRLAVTWRAPAAQLAMAMRTRDAASKDVPS